DAAQGTDSTWWQIVLSLASGVALTLSVLTNVYAVVAIVPVALLLVTPLFRRWSRTWIAGPLKAGANLLGFVLGCALAAAGVLLPIQSSWDALYAQAVGPHLENLPVLGDSLLNNLGAIATETQSISLYALAAAALVGVGFTLWQRMWAALPIFCWLLT